MRGLNLTVEKGRIVGLLGPNGCGKSTLIKLVAGLLEPDGGSIIVCGQERCAESCEHISYLPERTYLSAGMTVEGILSYFEDFYRDFDRSKAMAMLSDLKISPTVKLSHLSKGSREKVQLVLVMARKADLYILDEPIAGVDPAAREYILNTILNNRAKESSILITTHLIRDIEPILDDYFFMGYGGEILSSGHADEVRLQTGKSLDELFREVFRC